MLRVGEIVNVRCEGCDLERNSLMLGAGMLGVAFALCSCENCQRLIVKRELPGRLVDQLRCPYCRRAVAVLDFSAEHQPCPKCGGSLATESIGLWD